MPHKRICIALIRTCICVCVYRVVCVFICVCVRGYARLFMARCMRGREDFFFPKLDHLCKILMAGRYINEH